MNQRVVNIQTPESTGLHKPTLYKHLTGPLTPTQVRGNRRANYRESETDYNFYDTHLEPKLRLSERAARGIKRQRVGLTGGT